MSSVPLQQSLRHLQAAYRNFFVKTGDYPRFKSKKNGGAATYAASAFTWDWDKRELTLAKMRDPLPVRWSRTLPRKARPSTVTVSLDPSGRWHVSILVEEEVKHLPASPNKVGVDLGTEHFAILSTGEKIPNPRHLNHYAKKLEQAQQTLSRKQKGSNNHRKARLKVAKAYAKVKDCRSDFLHKLSTRLIRENQTVVIEDLAVENLTRRCAPKPDPEHPGRYLPNGQAAKTGLNRSIQRTMIEPIGGNEMPKSFAQQIEDDENKIKRIREHQRMVRAKQAKQERNARTKRLVETGAIVEKAHGGAYDDEGRQTFSDGLNGIISVYDPSRGGNVDMRVIDVIDRRIPRLPRSETTTGTAAAASRTVQATAPQPAHAQPQSFTPSPQRIEHRTGAQQPDRWA